MCTNFHLIAQDNSIVVGRAMDYTLPFKPFYIIRKRGSVLKHLYSEDRGSYGSAAGKYGYVAASVADGVPGLPGVSKGFATDGMNEAGLSAGFLYLRGTKYQEKDTQHPENNIFAPSLCSWVLANCGSVDELKELLPKHRVFIMLVPDEAFPLYLAVVDKTGKSVVVEFLEGNMNIIDNPVGVSTNEPTLPWHLQNLSRYQSLSYNTPEAFDIGDYPCKPFQYTGMYGLPGDSTSPSRFIRIAYARQFARQPKNSEHAYNVATHLLNMVDTPAGLARYADSDDSHQRWCVIKGLTTGVFAIRTYDNMNYTAVDLSKVDFSSVEDRVVPVPAMPLLNFIELPSE